MTKCTCLAIVRCNPFSYSLSNLTISIIYDYNAMDGIPTLNWFEQWREFIFPPTFTFHKQAWFLVRLFPKAYVTYWDSISLFFSKLLPTEFHSQSLHSGLQVAPGSPFISTKMVMPVSEPYILHHIVRERRGVSCPNSGIHPPLLSLNDLLQPGLWDVSTGFHQTVPIHEEWVNLPKILGYH